MTIRYEITEARRAVCTSCCSATLFLDKFLFRGELGEICFGPTCRALARWLSAASRLSDGHAAAGVGRQRYP